MTDDNAPTSDAAIERVVADDSRASRVTLGWPSLALAILFGLFYAYDLFEAISNVVGVSTQINEYNIARSKVGLAAVPTPWVVLIIDLLVPPAVYTAAFLLGRRHSLFVKTVYFLVGLTVVSAVSLSLVALA